MKRYIKREDKHIKSFLRAYNAKAEEEYIAEPIKEGAKKRPDYYIPELKTLIEIKEIHDTESNNNLAQWGNIIGKMRDCVNNHPEYSDIRGLYSVNTPPVFKFPTDKFQHKKAADEIINAIKANQESIKIHNVIFEIKRISESENGIYFGSIGGAGFIDPAGTIYQNIFNKITIANQQLRDFDSKIVEKRILLLVNRYHFADRIDEVIRGLSYGYNDLINYKNIDEIWLQLSLNDEKNRHILIYAKDYFEKYERNIPEPTTRNAHLYQLWYYALSEKDNTHKERLFNWLKSFLEDNPPNIMFNDKFKREEMVRLGEWLVQNERFDDAIWLINKFIDDPDPAEPDHYRGDNEFNYHQKILKGEDISIITTVLGHLAWTIQKLSLNKVYINNALIFTDRLLSHENLYVKLEAMVPLMEIASRRQWLIGYGKRPREGQYKRFHDLIFDVVDLVSKNEKCKAIAKRLNNIFSYYKDLSTEEALKVLDALKTTSEASGLFIYFGIFRRNHYKDQDIDFDGEILNEKLKEIITNSNKDYEDIKASISWHFWKILKENKDEFEVIKPYIDLLLEQPYQGKLFDNIERIINDLIKNEPIICTNWYKMVVNKIKEYYESENLQGMQRGLWLSHTEEIIEFIAVQYPDELIDIVKVLVELWKKGAFIGSPKRIFESFKLVTDEERKLRIKEEFMNLYYSMKKLNQKLEMVCWG